MLVVLKLLGGNKSAGKVFLSKSSDVESVERVAVNSSTPAESKRTLGSSGVEPGAKRIGMSSWRSTSCNSVRRSAST